jgi:hypothetical protein
MLLAHGLAATPLLQSLTHIGEMLLGKTGDETEQEQDHAMKHQSPVRSIFHCGLPFAVPPPYGTVNGRTPSLGKMPVGVVAVEGCTRNM